MSFAPWGGPRERCEGRVAAARGAVMATAERRTQSHTADCARAEAAGSGSRWEGGGSERHDFPAASICCLVACLPVESSWVTSESQLPFTAERTVDKQQ